jgi:hypothetical protein
VNGEADFRLADERSAYDRLAERLRHREEAIAALTAERDGLAERAKLLNSELLDAAVRRDRAEHQVRMVRDLHRSATIEVGLPPGAIPRCVICKVAAPCDTVRALDGTTPQTAAVDDTAAIRRQLLAETTPGELLRVRRDDTAEGAS